VKQGAMEELTPGQAAVLVRNEQEIDRSKEELEDLEEALCESIGDSIRGRKRAAAGEPDKKKAAKRRCGCVLGFNGSAEQWSAPVSIKRLANSNVRSTLLRCPKTWFQCNQFPNAE
jgi:hypothetical protein